MANKLRPAIRFHGSKWTLAHWIISFMPPHKSYVEPFGGSFSVILQKPRVKIETVNDLNGRIVNYFQVLRDRPDELIRLIELTPWAEAEHELCKVISEDSFEDARRFHVLCWMSFRGGPFSPGMRIQKNWEGRGRAIADDLLDHNLYDFARRLLGVQILQKDALDIIERFKSVPETLIYLDPPYLEDDRVALKAYGEFEASVQDHIRWAEALLSEPNGMFMISGYANSLYKELYEDNGWKREDKIARTNSGNSKIESLWLSPKIIKNKNGLLL